MISYWSARLAWIKIGRILWGCVSMTLFVSIRPLRTLSETYARFSCRRDDCFRSVVHTVLASGCSELYSFIKVLSNHYELTFGATTIVLHYCRLLWYSVMSWPIYWRGYIKVLCFCQITMNQLSELATTIVLQYCRLLWYSVVSWPLRSGYLVLLYLSFRFWVKPSEHALCCEMVP